MEQNNLPESVQQLILDDREIYLVGTAHVSKESVEDVKTAVAIIEPDTICVELCEARYKTLQDPKNWRNMNIFRVIKEGKAIFMLAQLVMTSFYKQIGDQLGVQPGAEMMEGISQAKATNAQLVLIDRDVQVTLKRVWGKLGLKDKFKLFSQAMFGLFVVEKIDEEMIDELKKKDQIQGVLHTFGKEYPSIKQTLIDERDIYLSQKIRECSGKKVVAIVGAGHVPGMIEEIKKVTPLDSISTIPKPTLTLKLVKWGIPLLIIALFVYGFFYSSTEKSIQSIYIWIFVNGVFSALGALIALGHPLTVISAFIAAPITSLNPTIAAGWVSGLVQAWVKKPTVADLEDLPQAIASMKGFWQNSVSRILLVIAFSNLGSGIGTFVAASWIASRIIAG